MEKFEPETIEFLFALLCGLSLFANIFLILYLYLKSFNEKKKEQKPFGKYRHWDED